MTKQCALVSDPSAAQSYPQAPTAAGEGLTWEIAAGLIKTNTRRACSRAPKLLQQNSIIAITLSTRLDRPLSDRLFALKVLC
jgi:hypothetical protein